MWAINPEDALRARAGGSRVISKIADDLNRTFPDDVYLHGEPGQTVFRKSLQSYALLDRELGYCQGMSIVCAMLLKELNTHHEAQEIFWLFCSMMHRARPLFLSGVPGFMAIISCVDDTLALVAPELSEHLKQCGIEGQMHALYLQNLLHTVFCWPDIPDKVTTALWGWFVSAVSSQQLLRMMLKVVIALIICAAKSLLAVSSMEQFQTQFIQGGGWLQQLPWQTDLQLQPRALVLSAAALKLPVSARHPDFGLGLTEPSQQKRAPRRSCGRG